MIEIKTQEQLNNINDTINNLPTEGELIRIYPLENNREYVIANPILINRNNVSIEGYGVSNPIIKSQIIGKNTDTDSMIQIIGSSADHVLKNITIKNLQLVDGTNKGYHIIHCKNTRKISVIDCNLQNSYKYGINLFKSNECSILNNIFSNNNIGIYLENSQNNKVSYNNISNTSKNTGGIYLDMSSNNIITNNIITNTYYGVRSISEVNCYNIITRNICNANSQGIWLGDTQYCNISDNICVDNSTYNMNLSFKSNYNTICNNVCNDSSIGNGININYPCTGNSIVSNIGTKNNQIGLKTEYGCTNTLIYGNSITDNTKSNYEIASTGKFEMKYNI